MASDAADRGVGSYEILSELGKGGMGAVYLARDPHGREVALKVLLPELTTRPEYHRRFLNEALATARLRHPGLVEVLDCGVLPDGRTFMAMELLRGETLLRRLQRQGKLPLPEALAIVRTIAEAVAVAHGRGIVHRDLNPGNVFLIDGQEPPAPGAVKVLDFGIAKLLGGGEVRGTVSGTQTGQILGTPLYMSPEQCRGSQTVDQRADVYALGCIFYALLCGRPPFAHAAAGELIAAHIHERLAAPRALEPSIPAPFEAVLLAMLAKDPAQRPASMAAVLEALADAEQGRLPASAEIPAGATLALDAPYVARPRRRWPRVVAVLAPVAFVVTSAVFWWPRAPRRSVPWSAAGGHARAIGPVTKRVAIPTVAIDGKGRALVVWRQATDERFDIYAAIHDPVRGWQPAERLETDDSGDARSVTATMNDAGRAIVVWKQKTTGPYDLWVRRYEPGSGWAPAARFAREGLGDVLGIEVSVDADGHGWVLWQQRMENRQRLWALRCRSGAPCGPIVRMDAGDDSDASEGKIRQSPSGRAFAVWSHQRGESRSVWTRVLGQDDTWGPAQQLSPTDTESPGPHLAANEHGHALVSWRQSDGAMLGVWARFHGPHGWGPAVKVVGQAEDCGHGDVGLDSQGRAVIVWRQTYGTDEHVFGARFQPDGGWAAPQRLDGATSRKSRTTDMTMDHTGAAIAVWQQEAGELGVWANRLDPERGWSGPVRLDLEAERARLPRAVIKGKSIFAAWLQACQGGGDCIWARQW